MSFFKDKISEIRTKLIICNPFFGIFLLNTNLVEDNRIPTAATDGISIFYNTEFFASLSNDEIMGVMFHEILHIVYLHCSRDRRQTRNQVRWNIAADYSINWEILQLGYKLPSMALVNTAYKNLTTEEIYDKLPNNAKENTLDTHIESKLNEAQKQQIEGKILSAYEISKGSDRTKLSSNLERLIKSIKNPVVPWGKIFQKLLGSAIDYDQYNFNKPNRRFLSQDLYMPSSGLYSKVNRLGIFVDVSGSIGEAEINAFGAEIRKASSLVGESVVAGWDTKVSSYNTIIQLSDFAKAVNFKGGGSTDVACVFDEIKKRKDIFDALIILTDGYFGDLPKSQPVNYPVIFVITSDVDIRNRWGKVVRMKVNS